MTTKKLWEQHAWIYGMLWLVVGWTTDLKNMQPSNWIISPGVKIENVFNHHLFMEFHHPKTWKFHHPKICNQSLRKSMNEIIILNLDTIRKVSFSKPRPFKNVVKPTNGVWDHLSNQVSYKKPRNHTRTINHLSKTICQITYFGYPLCIQSNHQKLNVTFCSTLINSPVEFFWEIFRHWLTLPKTNIDIWVLNQK